MPVLSTRSPEWRDGAAALLRAAPARAGGCRVLGIEGRTGAGKTALGESLAARLRCPVVHMDDLYPGWEGLAASIPRVRDRVLAPLRAGRSPSWRRWDWAAEDWAPDDADGRTSVDADPAGTLLIEGCGIGAAALRPSLSLLAWVDAPEDVRGARLDARWDAALYHPYRALWAAQEDAFYASDTPREHADLLLDNP